MVFIFYSLPPPPPPPPPTHTHTQSQGPHLYQTCPSSNYYDCKAMAIGARSQSARTYLEKHLDTFPGCEGGREGGGEGGGGGVWVLLVGDMVY